MFRLSARPATMANAYTMRYLSTTTAPMANTHAGTTATPAAAAAAAGTVTPPAAAAGQRNNNKTHHSNKSHHHKRSHQQQSKQSPSSSSSSSSSSTSTGAASAGAASPPSAAAAPPAHQPNTGKQNYKQNKHKDNRNNKQNQKTTQTQTQTQAPAPPAASPPAATPAVASSAPSSPTLPVVTMASLNLPAGKLISSYTPPPYVPSDPRVRRRGFLGTIRHYSWEFYESAIWKLSHPILTLKNVFDPSNFALNQPNQLALKHQWNRFKAGFGFRLETVEPYRTCLTFSPEKTDLSKYVLLNDNPFGGESQCKMELKEYDSVDTLSGLPTKKYTIVFSGELKNMAPFQTSSSRWSDDQGRPAEPIATKTPTGADEPIVKRSELLNAPPSNRPTPGGGLAESLSSTPPTPTTPTTINTNVNPFTTPTTQPTSPPATPTPATPPPPRRRHGLINGFAAFISPLFEYPDLDLERYDFITMNVRTDGRPYIFNIRCREGLSSSHGNVYQARLKAEVPRPMHKMEIRFENMICTQSGRMRSWGTSMPKDRIESFGFSVTGPPGPFELELELIAAQIGTPDFEIALNKERAVSDALDRQRKLDLRMQDLDRRRAVQVELDALRRSRGPNTLGRVFAEGGPPGLLQHLFGYGEENSFGESEAASSRKARASTAPESTVDSQMRQPKMNDISTYPKEVQAEMLLEERKRREALEATIAKETADAKLSDNTVAHARGKLTQEELRQILSEVNEEIKYEKRVDDLLVGGSKVTRK